MLLTARPNSLRSLTSILHSIVADRLDRPPTPTPRPEPAETPECSPVIARIMDLNPTASPEYLGSFSRAALDRYLAHLECVGSPRGARWERPGDSSAILMRETEF